MKRSSLIVSLDVGTHKVAAIVADATEDGVEVVGIGTAPSTGLRKGVVVNIDATVEAIRKAVGEAEIMAGCEIYSAIVGLSGGHVRSQNAHGAVPVKSPEIGAGDVERVIEAASAIVPPTDRQVLQILPQEFVVDDQDGIREPIGMAGVRLEANVHVVTASVAAVQNVLKCCERSGLAVSGMVLGPVASAEAVLTPEERDLGVALVDVGGGTTDLVVYRGGAVRHTAVLPVGGQHLTSDLVTGLRTPFPEAEKLKHRHGAALSSLVPREEQVEVPSMAGREPRLLSRQILAQILEPRVEEIFQLVGEEIVRARCEEALASGVVVTGGTTILPGVPALAEQVFHLPVRRSAPREIGGLVEPATAPMYSTGVGLVLWAARERDDAYGQGDGFWGRMRGRLSDIFREIF